MVTPANDPGAQRVRRDLQEARDLLDRLEHANASMARRAVPRLRRQVEQLSFDLNLPDADVSVIEQNASRLVHETFTAYAGALVRGEGVDRGMCELADYLLDEITAADADWAGLPTILGAEESITPLSGVVHLRYPIDSIWSVPLVAHELGHYVAPKLSRVISQGLHSQTILPVQALLEAERERVGSAEGVSAWSHLVEVFADVFATWVAGPAYACSLIMLRLNRALPDDATFQHPSPSSRVTAVLRTLRRLDEVTETYVKPNTTVATYLEQWWSANATAATAPIDPLGLGLLPLQSGGFLDHGTVERYLDDVLSIIERDLSTSRFKTTDAAARIQEALAQRNERKPPLDGARLLDVLTAAWRVRAKGQQNVSEARLTSRAEALCMRIMGAVSLPQ